MLLATVKIIGASKALLNAYSALKAPTVRNRRARVEAQLGPKDNSKKSRGQIKAIREELKLSLLLAAACLVERVANQTLSWLPFYEQFKIVLWIWLLISKSFLAPSFVVALYRILRPYESCIDWTLHTLDDVTVIAISALTWLFRPITRLWSIVKVPFQSRTPPTPVPVQKRRMRYSMRADFPGALPKTPAPVSSLKGNLLSPASPFNAPQDILNVFKTRYPTTEDAPVMSRHIEAVAANSTTTHPKTRQAAAANKIARAPIKKKDANAPSNKSKASATVLGKRKVGPTKLGPQGSEGDDGKAKKVRSVEKSHQPVKARPDPSQEQQQHQTELDHQAVHLRRSPRKSAARQPSSVQPTASSRTKNSASSTQTTRSTQDVKEASKVPIRKRKFPVDEALDQSKAPQVEVEENRKSSPARKRRVASRTIRTAPHDPSA